MWRYVYAHGDRWFLVFMCLCRMIVSWLVSRDNYAVVSVQSPHVNVSNVPTDNALAGQALLAIFDPVECALDHCLFGASYCW